MLLISSIMSLQTSKVRFLEVKLFVFISEVDWTFLSSEFIPIILDSKANLYPQSMPLLLM